MIKTSRDLVRGNDGEESLAISRAVSEAVVDLVRLIMDRRRPAFLFAEVPTRVVTPEELAGADPTFQTLRNLNTPEEYEAALREAAG